jgi:hypothetical protein
LEALKDLKEALSLFKMNSWLKKLFKRDLLLEKSLVVMTSSIKIKTTLEEYFKLLLASLLVS